MRYADGLLGGGWLTAMTSDLSNGTFDGTWLILNFDSMNPANSLWGTAVRGLCQHWQRGGALSQVRKVVG